MPLDEEHCSCFGDLSGFPCCLCVEFGARAPAKDRPHSDSSDIHSQPNIYGYRNVRAWNWFCVNAHKYWSSFCCDRMLEGDDPGVCACRERNLCSAKQQRHFHCCTEVREPPAAGANCLITCPCHAGRKVLCQGLYACCCDAHGDSPPLIVCPHSPRDDCEFVKSTSLLSCVFS